MSDSCRVPGSHGAPIFLCETHATPTFTFAFILWLHSSLLVRPTRANECPPPKKKKRCPWAPSPSNLWARYCPGLLQRGQFSPGAVLVQYALSVAFTQIRFGVQAKHSYRQGKGKKALIGEGGFAKVASAPPGSYRTVRYATRAVPPPPAPPPTALYCFFPLPDRFFVSSASPRGRGMCYAMVFR